VAPYPARREGPAQQAGRAGVRPQLLLAALVVGVPTLLALIYYGLIASPVYVSEASFLVRSASPQQPAGVSSLLQGAGIVQGSADAYAVHDYVLSRDAMKRVDSKLPLRSVFGPSGADFLTRFPRPFEGRSNEHLFRAYHRFVSVGYDASSGVSTLTVRAFKAEDARKTAEELLQGGEDLVNQLNARAERDAIDHAQGEVLSAQIRVAEAENALTGFRSREKLIDPNRSSVANLELIGRLSEQLSSLRAERAGLAASAPQSPQLPGLDNRIQAYQSEINKEQARATGESDSLAPKIGRYEQLVLARDFAGRTLTSALGSLDEAQQESRRKRLYLQRISQPSLPDSALQPRRLRGVWLVLLTSLLAYGAIVLVLAGLREHRQ